MAVTVNATLKRARPSPAKTVKRTAIKKTAAKPAKRSAPKPKRKPAAKKKSAPKPKPAAAKKPVARKPVKKVTTVKKTVRKAAPIRRDGELAKWYGPNRKLYLPSGLLTTADIPSYLNGTLAGDYGFDPLGLGEGGKIEQYRVAEVIHARWAMLAIPGVVIPEALGIAGGDWRETGAVFLTGTSGREGGQFWLLLALAAQVVLVGSAENFRTKPDSAPPGEVPFKGKFSGNAFRNLDPINPVGPLDFYNVASNPQDLAILKVKEIKNGRLAMVSMLGVFVQGLTTGEGPAANWGKHIHDPFGYNFVTKFAVDRTPSL